MTSIKRNRICTWHSQRSTYLPTFSLCHLPCGRGAVYRAHKQAPCDCTNDKSAFSNFCFWNNCLQFNRNKGVFFYIFTITANFVIGDCSLLICWLLHCFNRVIAKWRCGTLPITDSGHSPVNFEFWFTNIFTMVRTKLDMCHYFN